jgi:hypothetical protein
VRCRTVWCALVGRPRKERDQRPAAVQARLEPDEYAAWERLIASRAEELRPQGVKVTASDVLRWLILREVAARGLDKAAAAEPSANASKGRRGKPVAE